MDWKKKTILFGVGVGALLGFVTAKMMILNAEDKGGQVTFDVQSGTKMAMTLLDTIRKLS